jgi:hypothetical protein
MSLFDRPPIRRDHDGYAIRLREVERALLTHLPDQLNAQLDGMTADGEVASGLGRLFPHAHAMDGEAEARYIEGTRDDLISARRDALDVIARTAGADHISDDDADAWLGAINVLRLTIGTRLGIAEDQPEVLESEPAYADWICYQYLSYLESELVDAMTGALPPPVPGAGDELPDDPWGEPLGGLRWDGTPAPERPEP